MNINRANGEYEVLSPWAEAEPIPLRGIASRVTDLEGKKIGLLCNNKRAARPILTVVEEKLRERFPTSEFSWFTGRTFSVSELEPENKARFEEWVKAVDAVVTAVGD